MTPDQTTRVSIILDFIFPKGPDGKNLDSKRKGTLGMILLFGLSSAVVLILLLVKIFSDGVLASGGAVSYLGVYSLFYWIVFSTQLTEWQLLRHVRKLTTQNLPCNGGVNQELQLVLHRLRNFKRQLLYYLPIFILLVWTALIVFDVLTRNSYYLYYILCCIALLFIKIGADYLLVYSQVKKLG